MNTKEEEKKEAMNKLPIYSHEKRNGEGRRRGKLTKFRSRGRGRREEEDDVLGFSWNASNLHLQEERDEERLYNINGAFHQWLPTGASLVLNCIF